ncbi:hypothetical protein [Limnohabitans sp. 2KL-17]|uniref:hypothetical protein n=1 Tax=Limnohabitans sp. 2KL-17 TaxID=1100704 RepID=UPI001E2BEFAD|nr:hypothetical protein [Limnohabitans sp. 2KL-17]
MSHFDDKPALETAGWLPRLPIEELVFQDQWGNAAGEGNRELIAKLRAIEAATGISDFPN